MVRIIGQLSGTNNLVMVDTIRGFYIEDIDTARTCLPKEKTYLLEKGMHDMAEGVEVASYYNDLPAKVPFEKVITKKGNLSLRYVEPMYIDNVMNLVTSNGTAKINGKDLGKVYAMTFVGSPVRKEDRSKRAIKAALYFPQCNFFMVINLPSDGTEIYSYLRLLCDDRYFFKLCGKEDYEVTSNGREKKVSSWVYASTLYNRNGVYSSILYNRISVHDLEDGGRLTLGNILGILERAGLCSIPLLDKKNCILVSENNKEGSEFFKISLYRLLRTLEGVGDEGRLLKCGECSEVQYTGMKLPNGYYIIEMTEDKEHETWVTIGRYKLERAIGGIVLTKVKKGSEYEDNRAN